MKNRKGFTLVELLITIVIMGILGGIAINVFFPSMTKTYVAMLKQDMTIAAKENLEYYTKYGEFAHISGYYVRPSKNGKIKVSNNVMFDMSYPQDQGMQYKARLRNVTCTDTGKPGMLLEYWLNDTGRSKPVLYGKYNSCTQSKPRVWEQVYKDGKKTWEER